MKKIFLTGASSGIGRATAEALLARGHEVWGTTRDAARIPARERLHAVTLDLCQREAIAPTFARAWEEAGGFDVVINNAGSGHFDPAELLTDDKLRAQFELLVFGQIQLCQLALRAMRERPGGLIINLTSLASRLPVPFTAAYNAAKAALAAWTLTTQLELGNAPVRLIDLQPADIATEFNESVDHAPAEDSRYRARQERAWRVIDKNMTGAPPPSLVAERIARLLEEPNPAPRLTIGDVFQTRVAPAIFSLLPPRLRVWGLRRYYRL